MDVYRALMAHRIHQDELLWSRVQTLIAVQGAILTGSYLVRSYWLGPLIAFAGALLTSFIGLLLCWDDQDQKVNQSLMDELAKEWAVGSSKTYPGLPDLDGLYIRFTARPVGLRHILGGRRIIHVVVVGLIGVDLMMGLLYCVCPCAFPSPH